jgi:hypothetical protein
MEAIERLLTEHGETVVYATRGGDRVHPATAYHADPPAGDGEVTAVECGWDGTQPSAVVDHHRPGDPGYGRVPGEFLGASSIGQVLAKLARRGKGPAERIPWMVQGVAGTLLPPYAPPGADDPDWWVYTAEYEIGRVPTDIVLAAAADHCLAHAYAGRCPGVDPDKLMAWRVQSRAVFQRREPTQIMAWVEEAREALRAAPRLTLGEHDVADMRGPVVKEIPEAAARDGVAYVSGPLRSPDGRDKYTCSGPAEVVEAFLAAADRFELVDTYGDPARGFAGGYRQ